MDKLYDAQARKLIRTLANSVIGKYGFRRGDRDDIEQELALDLCQRSATFDETRSDRRSFVTSILRNKLRSLIRANRRLKRQCTEDDDLLDRIPDGAHRHYAPPRVGDDLAQLELQLDVATIMDKLPPDLRELCEQLQVCDSPHAAARRLGLTRRGFEKQIAALRRYFQKLQPEK
jgi:RNA polymerase sigma factor (sigma-70 family)